MPSTYLLLARLATNFKAKLRRYKKIVYLIITNSSFCINEEQLSNSLRIKMKIADQAAVKFGLIFVSNGQIVPTAVCRRVDCTEMVCSL